MGRTTRSEKDVLKLIHPRKHIETYTKPIFAYEVLKKYPKFCITRPDVFQFPWLVVRPDSLLVPGKVFFLVPKRTLYRLLKTNHPPDGRSLPSLISHVSCSFSRPSLPLTTSAGMTPKHLTRIRKRLKPPREDDGMRSRKKDSHVESWLSSLPPPDVVSNKRTARYSSSHVHDCYKCGNVATSTDLSREDDVGNGGGRGGKWKTTSSLRSCMRKHGSAPRLPNLKVRFSIPNEDNNVESVTKQRKVIDSLSKLATSIMVDVCR